MSLLDPLSLKPLDQRFVYKNNPRLKAFIYLLVRDHVPFGCIEKIILDLGEAEEFDFSNEIMDAYAQQAVNRLMPFKP
jgi:hypothetical protein